MKKAPPKTPAKTFNRRDNFANLEAPIKVQRILETCGASFDVASADLDFERLYMRLVRLFGQEKKRKKLR